MEQIFFLKKKNVYIFVKKNTIKNPIGLKNYNLNEN